MPTCTRPAVDFTPEQLRFPPAVGFTIRGDIAGGEISSDLGALKLNAVGHRIGLIGRLTAAIADSRDTRYITHPLRDLVTQRVFQIASGYEGGNGANTLRGDPLFKLAADRAPLDTDNPLACGATHAWLEGALNSRNIYRMARALVLRFIAGYSCAGVRSGQKCLGDRRAEGLMRNCARTSRLAQVTGRSGLGASRRRSAPVQ